MNNFKHLTKSTAGRGGSRNVWVGGPVWVGKAEALEGGTKFRAGVGMGGGVPPTLCGRKWKILLCVFSILYFPYYNSTHEHRFVKLIFINRYTITEQS